MSQFYPWYPWYSGTGLPADNDEAKALLGGKGAGLFEMKNAGCSVPEFVVIPTQLCRDYMVKPAETKMKVKAIAKEITDTFTKKLGFLPLLSVRSGARVSMPGMMDTVLNVGMFDEATDKVVSQMNDRMRQDCKRRFLHMFGTTVRGLPDKAFEEIMAAARKSAKAKTDAELTAVQLKNVVLLFEGVYAAAGKALPGSVREQIFDCIIAVMDSWNSERAKVYRKEHDIPDDWGTAVVVQRMVFGNMNDDSGSGVLFTRDPVTGQPGIHAEYLANAQGEDVVAGIRTPQKLNLVHEANSSPEGMWKAKLFGLCHKLEERYADMLDIEFTVENGELFLLQVRNAKRSARAWVRSSLDMLADGMINRDTVRQRIRRGHVKTLSRPVIDPAFKSPPQLTGIPACAGVVTGEAVFTAEAAVKAKSEGRDCILIRHETSPDDIAGMFAAVGILTATGGSTSHAAVVARGMDKVCVTGCEDLKFGTDGVVFGPGKLCLEGNKVTLDGSTGNVWLDVEVPVSDPANDKELADLLAFVREDCPAQSFVNLPGSPGTVFMMSRFIVDTPVIDPGSKIIVVEDSDALEDPLVTCVGDANMKALLVEIGAWAHDNKVHVEFYGGNGTEDSVEGEDWSLTVKGASDNLESLLQRPVSQADLEHFFKGSLETVAQLVAPTKLADKFNIVACARYELLAAFEE